MSRGRWAWARDEGDPHRTFVGRDGAEHKGTVVTPVNPGGASSARIFADALRVCRRGPAPDRFHARLDLANDRSLKVAIELQRAGVPGDAIEWFDSGALARAEERARKIAQRTCGHEGARSEYPIGGFVGKCDACGLHLDAATMQRVADAMREKFKGGLQPIKGGK